MSRYEYSDDKRNVIIDGNPYGIFRELIYVGEPVEGQVPYIRRTTKINVFKDYKEHHPEMYNVLRKQSWFEAYINDVEGSPTKLVADGVDEALGTKAEQKSFEGVIGQLAEQISEMGKAVKEMNTNTKLEEALIEGIISKGKEIAVEEIRQELVNNLDEYIKDTYGQLPDRLIITKEDVEYEKTGLFHKEFDKVVKLVNLNLPVMLTGGAGSGKNYMLSQVAEVLNLGFYYTSTVTQEYKLTGFIDGGGVFHETEFYKAFTQGGVFMLDEIDASIPEALVILNGAIANGYFDFPNGREFAHDDFRVVCAGNTVGLGADMVYTGRNVLDGATLDRFVLVEIDYDERIESNLCQDEELRNFLYDVRKSVQRNKINHIIGMRAFKYTYEMLVNGFEKEFIVNSVVLKGLQQDDINVLKSTLNKENEWARYVG